MSSGIPERIASLVAAGATDPPSPHPAWLRRFQRGPVDVVFLADAVLAIIVFGTTESWLGTQNALHGHRFGPVVLLFFRFANCPACNISLRHYQQELYPALTALGANLVAISPQVPEKLAAIRNRFGFGFPVASDSDYQLTRSLGITFTSSPEQQERDRAKGGGLAAELGTGQWELPYPTIVVVDSRGVVTFADVHPDWLVRTEAPAVIDAVRSLVQVPA